MSNAQLWLVRFLSVGVGDAFPFRGRFIQKEKEKIEMTSTLEMAASLNEIDLEKNHQKNRAILDGFKL